MNSSFNTKKNYAKMTTRSRTRKSVFIFTATRRIGSTVTSVREIALNSLSVFEVRSLILPLNQVVSTSDSRKTRTNDVTLVMDLLVFYS
jgi:hypothetical protein